MNYKRIWKENKKEYVVKVYGRREEGIKKRKMVNTEEEAAGEVEEQKYENDSQEKERTVYEVRERGCR